METKFLNADQKNVAAFIVYGKAADSKLYYESTYTTQVTKTDAKAAFDAGLLLIIAGDDHLCPVALNGTKVSTVKLVSTAATVTEWTCANS